MIAGIGSLREVTVELVLKMLISVGSLLLNRAPDPEPKKIRL